MILRNPIGALLIACASGTVAAADLPPDLTELSLNDLLDIEVTSVSRHAEPLHEAAAAIFVLTGEEIRRSGARSIAEALRMVPGLQVARFDANSYQITSRGMGTDKLEVRLDGRSVYSPLTSTVFWDALDTYLPDIDRIEVIRGPGAALWGANAVNGVINIVTRPSSETHGTQVVAAVGNEEKASAALRAGASLGDRGDVRVYALAHERDASVQPDGAHSSDGGSHAQAGFRADLLTSPDSSKPGDQLMVSSDFYKARERAVNFTGGAGHIDVTGANATTRWTHPFGPTSDLSIQAYYDTDRRNQATLYAEKRETVDFDLQHRFDFGKRHQVIWGFGYRRTSDNIGQPPDDFIFVEPAERVHRTWSAFAQDQIALAGDRGQLTLGSKFEHNDITGFEAQPNLKLGWRLSRDWFTWGSIARAVRMPNRFDTDVAAFCPPPNGFPGFCGPGDIVRLGNPDVKSETLIAYEWGLRMKAGNGFSADLALFHNDYDRLINGISASSSALGGFSNDLRAKETGGELVLTWAARADLDLQAWFAALHVDARSRSGAPESPDEEALEGRDPREQAGLRVNWRPASGYAIDSFLRYVGHVRAQDTPAYTELDLRGSWRPLPSLEVALVGQNLLHASHVEQGADASDAAAGFAQVNRLQRSVLLELSWEWK
ncbi:MAG TPA: TonB-dependent receptor [Nevskiaceae bacterium]|nr:TonB-dependent receptor [Nevskiaceae bacterium]